MGMKSCVECEWQGPELPGPAAAREIHRALHGLGRRFLEALDPIVAAFVPIKPLENLDAPELGEVFVDIMPKLPEFNLNEVRFRGEVPPGGRIVQPAPYDPAVLEANMRAIEEEIKKGPLFGSRGWQP
ncbi:hypothetical protein PBI_DAOB_63 [Arthrobacter phage Daob]|uniref:Uncharacterized protein n=1 Tax=Arthrobacter phage Daob TaxID=2419954 RepID=A0A3G2KFH5_9CAUD|nr:hypothetical protein PBI_DAOB_63 [Arthrobacter phage Daob]